MHEKKKLLSRLFERKNWKKVVQILSCLVVFCTTYALILPAITQEAKAYCGHEAHEHSDKCYETILSCTKKEHHHSDECYGENGSIQCALEEHEHSADCYREVMNCDKEVHQHSLICFSNPDADLETADDWVKSLPDEKEPTTRENVIAAAKSQENVKESSSNYQVDDETEIRGITRYGQWDSDPYVDEWSCAFARFVLHYGGVNSEKIHSKKELLEWMDELDKHELLSHVSEGKPGDVIFIENEEEEIRAGFILEIDEKEDSLTAMMGNWEDQVSKQKYSLNSDKIHSVFKLPVDDDPVEKPEDEETETNVNQSESVDNPITDSEDSKQESDNNESEKKEKNKDSSDQTPKETPDADEPKAVYTGEFETNLLKLKADWDKDTFSAPAEFNAGSVELDEAEDRQIREELKLSPREKLAVLNLQFFESTKTNKESKTDAENSDPIKDEESSVKELKPQKALSYKFSLKESKENNWKFRSVIIPSKSDGNDVHSPKEENGNSVEIEEDYTGRVYVVYYDEDEFDYSQSSSLDDGTTITASWNSDAFDPDLEITFQARLKETSPAEIKQIEEQMAGESFDAVTYDLSFYKRDTDSLSLVEVEPSSPVRIEIVQPKDEQSEVKEDSLQMIHHISDEKAEKIEQFEIKNPDEDKQSLTFYLGSFSDVSVVSARSSAYGFYQLKTQVESAASGATITLESDASDGNGCIDIKNKDITINLNGHTVSSSSKPFFIENSTVVINNGTIKNTYQSGGQYDQRIIMVENSTVTLNNVTLEDGKNGGILLDRGSTLNMNGGKISNCGTWTKGVDDAKNWSDDKVRKRYHGGAIYAIAGSKIVLSQGAVIEGCWAAQGGGIALGWTDNTEDKSALIINDAIIKGCTANMREGGAIAMTYKTNCATIIYKAEIYDNKSEATTDWGGGGIFAADDTYVWLPNGASIYNNTATGLGGGLTGCSTGKILIDEKMHIVDNTAQANRSSGFTGTGEGGSDKQNDHDYINNWNYNQGFRGNDIFGAKETEVVGIFSDGQKANWNGLVGTTQVTDEQRNSGASLESSYWMLLDSKAENKDALKNQPVKIYNNTSWKHGGGILINGWLISGKYVKQRVGDYFDLNGVKKYVDSDGNSLSLENNQFKFGVFKADDTAFANPIAIGTVSEDGTISFDQSIYVETSQESGEQTVSFLVKETGELPSNIIPDGKVLKLEVTTNLKESPTTMYLPQWNEKTQQYEVIKVTTYRYFVSRVVVKDNATGQALRTWEFKKNDNKLINTGDAYTFVNTEVPKKNISVSKKWEDENGNPAAAPTGVTVEVQLFRKKSGETDYPATPYKTETLSSANNWTCEFKDLDPDYDYDVREVFDNPLYEAPRIEQTFDENQKSVWVKASSIQTGKQYLVVSKEKSGYNGNFVVLKGTGSGTSSRVNGSDKTVTGSAGKTVSVNGTTYSDVLEYSPKSNELFTAENFQFNAGQGFALRSSNNTYLRVEEYGSQNDISGLMMSNGDQMKSEGGPVSLGSSSNLLQKRRYSDSTNKTVYYDTGNQWFSSSTKSFSNPNNVYLYENLAYTEQDSTHIQFTITNKKKNKYSVQITKQDGESHEALSGIKFKLYSDETGTTPLNFTQKGTVYQLGAEGTVSELVSDEDGLIRIENLDPGTYWLEETATLDGYMLLDHRVEIVVSAANDTDQNMTIDLTVDNYKAYELPETGGIGTLGIQAAGSAMILSAAAFYGLNRKRRRKEGEN